MLATYEIVCSKGYDADTAAAVKSFLTVSANEGQANLSAAGYVPLPDAFKERLLKSVDAIALVTVARRARSTVRMGAGTDDR